jgi:hypothetical protein
MSVEFDTRTGDIVSSVYGNWSLVAKKDHPMDFSAVFKKQNVAHTSSLQAENKGMSSHIQQDSSFNIDASASDPSAVNAVTYSLSNFMVNSINQQNLDIAYKGKIDVSRAIDTGSNGSPTIHNEFRGIDISVSVLGNRILVIGFDPQSPLFNEFKNIPLVGLVM